jgi:hypothetical protein
MPNISMVYKPSKLDLSNAQAKKVLQSKPVRLRADQLGVGVEHMFHPENYKRLMRAKRAGKGLTLDMAHGEIAATHASELTGAGFWGDVWRGIKKGDKFVKDSGILSKLLDAGVPAAATYLGQPSAAIPVRAGIKQLTGVGLEPIDGGRLSVADVKSGAMKAFAYAKKGIVSYVSDQGEKFLLSKSDRPDHQEMIRGVLRGIRRKYGVGMAGGSFRLGYATTKNNHDAIFLFLIRELPVIEQASSMQMEPLPMSAITSAYSHALILGIRLNSLLKHVPERVDRLSLTESAL